MTFFLDNNLSPHLAEGMRAFEEDVTHLQDNFPRDAKDVDWLPTVAQRGWLLVTCDERIRKNPAEPRALRQYAVGVFFLSGKNRSRCDLIQQLVRNWIRIKELGRNTRPPYAFRVPPTGTKIERRVRRSFTRRRKFGATTLQDTPIAQSPNRPITSPDHPIDNSPIGSPDRQIDSGRLRPCHLHAAVTIFWNSSLGLIPPGLCVKTTPKRSRDGSTQAYVPSDPLCEKTPSGATFQPSP